MKSLAFWLIPAVCMAVGLYFLSLSFRAYAKWHEYVTRDDYSGAEAYEVEFWPEVSFGLALVVLSAFLAGRWTGK